MHTQFIKKAAIPALALAVVFSGIAYAQTTIAAYTVESTELYQVKKGDTLSKIARDQLGDMSRWRELAELNGLKNPNLIYPGQGIALPAEEVVTAFELTEVSPAPATVLTAAPTQIEQEQTPLARPTELFPTRTVPSTSYFMDVSQMR